MGRGWPCWWYFKLTGVVPGETISIDMGGDKWAQPIQASFSIDQKNWKHTSPGEKHEGCIIYRQQVDATVAWFSWGPPFTHEDAAELVERTAQKSPYAKPWVLCRSREGRFVPALRVMQPSDKDTDNNRYGIWVGARQHAWESGSSWTARGFIEWLVSDEPRAEALRKKASVVVVPLMDVDNVAIGAGGKNQIPQDHNRDWTANPYHPAVAAAQREIKLLDNAGRFDLYIDLHNPAPANRDPYFYVPPQSQSLDRDGINLQHFLTAMRSELTAPLAFRGKTVESDARYDKLWNQISSVWVTQNTARHVVATTLEVPWNTPQSTTEGYRAVGRKMGLAIDRYFHEAPKR